MNIQTNLRNGVVSSHNEGTEEVIPTIATGLKDGYLRARQDDRLAEVLEHEGQRRRSVSHRIGTVQHYKPVKVVVVCLRRRRIRSYL